MLVCRYLGHEVLGLDVVDNALYNIMIEYFQLPRIEVPIMANELMPTTAKPFDYITAYSINFHRYWQKGAGYQEWGTPEWTFFLEDVHSRLTTDGIFYLRLNIDGMKGIYGRPELKALFYNAPGFNTQIIDRRDIIFYRN